MLRKCFFLLLICFVGGFLYKIYNFYNSYNRYIPVLPQQIDLSFPVTVYSRVGGYMITLITGWTSPFAEVNLSGINLTRKTTANEQGFFAFYYLPIVEGVREICLIAQDVNQLASYPLCLPLPEGNRDIEIKDVLLSPTIQVQDSKIPAGKTAKASGMAFPDSKVEVYLFSENRFSLWAKIYNIYNRYNIYKIFFPNKVQAVGLPQYQVKANENGYFEFSLPASVPSVNRIFAVAQKESFGNSSKSNTLAFQVLGIFGLLKLFLENFFKEAWAFFASLPSNTFWIILLEILILLALVILVLRRKNRDKNEAL